MSSDADYEAFLNKANQDVSGGGDQATNQSKRTKGIDVGSTEQVSHHLSQVDAYMTSDSDEPFEQFSLKFDGDKLPSAGAWFCCFSGCPPEILMHSLGKLSELIGTSAETISEKDFDPKNQYSDVVEAVKRAGDGHVGFFKVELDSTRTQYLIISVSFQQSLLLGFKVLAVESWSKVCGELAGMYDYVFGDMKHQTTPFVEMKISQRS
jgi:hypothetical protein